MGCLMFLFGGCGLFVGWLLMLSGHARGGLGTVIVVALIAWAWHWAWLRNVDEWEPPTKPKRPAAPGTAIVPSRKAERTQASAGLLMDGRLSGRAVKARYRRLAMENHPDHGGDVDSFLRIKEAYEQYKESEDARK